MLSYLAPQATQNLLWDSVVWGLRDLTGRSICGGHGRWTEINVAASSGGLIEVNPEVIYSKYVQHRKTLLGQK